MAKREKKNEVARILEVMHEFNDKLKPIIAEMEEIAEKEDNIHIGQIANIMVTVCGSMENPYDIIDLHELTEYYAAKKIMERLDDKGKTAVQKSLERYAKE